MFKPKSAHLNTQHQISRRSAFTLIELLVVIAIISLLAAILFPVFGRARENARRSSCSSNLKQLGTAFQQYQQDYDGLFPKGWDILSPPVNGFGQHLTTADPIDAWTHWPWFYGSYVKNIAIFDCPSSPDVQDQLTAANWGNDGNYGYNYDGLSRDVSTPGRADAEIEKPAEVFVFFDSGDAAVRAGTNDWAGLLEELDLDWDSKQEGALRHQGRTNVVFADGHVKTITPAQLLKRNADNIAPWMIEWTDCAPTCTDPPFDSSLWP